MNITCFHCGKRVSTNVPDNTIFRAVAICPECVEKQPDIIPRRPLCDDEPEGYLESDNDFVDNNIEACVWFLEQDNSKEDRK